MAPQSAATSSSHSMAHAACKKFGQRGRIRCLVPGCIGKAAAPHRLSGRSLPGCWSPRCLACKRNLCWRSYGSRAHRWLGCWSTFALSREIWGRPHSHARPHSAHVVVCKGEKTKQKNLRTNSLLGYADLVVAPRLHGVMPHVVQTNPSRSMNFELPTGSGRFESAHVRGKKRM